MQDVLMTRGHGTMQRNPHTQRIQRSELALFQVPAARLGRVVKAFDPPTKRVRACHLDRVFEGFDRIGRVQDPFKRLLAGGNGPNLLAHDDDRDGHVGDKPVCVLCTKPKCDAQR
jgi:hypothetical protein